MRTISSPGPLIAAWSYAAPALPLSALALSFYVFLPKVYTDYEGISLGEMGIIILLSRIWDAFLDPWIGRLSDRTRSKMGRRRPWMFFGVFPLALVLFFLFSPQLRPGFIGVSWWFGGLAFLFFFFWTLVNVPYEALGAELTPDYHQRTQILAKRDGMLLLGTLLGGALPEILKRTFSAGAQQELSINGFLLALLSLGAVLLCVARIRERQPSGLPSHSPPGLFSTFAQALANRHFRILLCSYAISSLGAALPASLILYYVEDVLGSDRGHLFLLIYLCTGFLFLPLWVLLSRRLEKKTTWLLSMFLNTIAFLFVLGLGKGDEVSYGILVFLSGIGLGATLAIPSSMQADVIDYDELLSGERREGLYVGLWSIVKKASAAVGAGVGFLLLERAGYTPDARGQGIGESARSTLSFLYAGMPSICNLLAILVALPYGLNRAEHEKIRQELGKRSYGAAVASDQ